MPALILFDIDETMVSSDGAGRRALEAAMSAVLKKPISSEGHSLSGKTDPQICREILSSQGYSDEQITESLDSIYEAYVPLLEEEVRTAREFRIHTGVVELLDRLKALPEAYLGLLTGNIERGARIKLKPFNLNQYFSFGAFGSDSHNRMDLPKVAHDRAATLFKQPFTVADIVIIGDARNDVLCAQGYGAKSVAVCTGKTPKETLVELKPNYLFDNLGDTDKVIEAIFAR